MRPSIWLGGILVASLFAAGQSAAQGLLPQPRTYDLMVADTSGDQVARFADLNQDGIYNTAGEWVSYYDPAISGGPAITNPSSLCFDTRGRLYISDTGIDAVLVTCDYTGDGGAHTAGSGEYKIYFDTANLSGFVLGSINTIRMDRNNVMWGTNPGVSAYPDDVVFRAEDLNSDGDCQDVGEITIVYDSNVGDYLLGVPTALTIDPNAEVMYVSDVNNSSGVGPVDGIYRMEDLNGDNDFNDSGECTIFYSGTEAYQPGLSYAADLCFHPNGDLYLVELTSDRFTVLRDVNGDGDCEDLSESWAWADAAINAMGRPNGCNGFEIDEYGRVIAPDYSADTIVMYQDKNADNDADDPGEIIEIWDNAIGPGAMTNSKEIALVPTPFMSTPTPVVYQGYPATIDFKGTDSDTSMLILGLTYLGSGPLPPYGILTHSTDIILGPLPLNSDGELKLTATIPVGAPAVTMYFSHASGKSPYRLYLSNPIAIRIAP